MKDPDARNQIIHWYNSDAVIASRWKALIAVDENTSSQDVEKIVNELRFLALNSNIATRARTKIAAVALLSMIVHEISFKRTADAAGAAHLASAAGATDTAHAGSAKTFDPRIFNVALFALFELLDYELEEKPDVVSWKANSFFLQALLRTELDDLPL